MTRAQVALLVGNGATGNARSTTSKDLPCTPLPRCGRGRREEGSAHHDEPEQVPCWCTLDAPLPAPTAAPHDPPPGLRLVPPPPLRCSTNRPQGLSSGATGCTLRHFDPCACEPQWRPRCAPTRTNPSTRCARNSGTTTPRLAPLLLRRRPRQNPHRPRTAHASTPARTNHGTGKHCSTSAENPPIRQLATQKRRVGGPSGPAASLAPRRERRPMKVPTEPHIGRPGRRRARLARVSARAEQQVPRPAR